MARRPSKSGLALRMPNEQNPEGPCNCMVYTWALQGFLYSYVGAYVCTVLILGPFGKGDGQPSYLLL